MINRSYENFKLYGLLSSDHDFIIIIRIINYYLIIFIMENRITIDIKPKTTIKSRCSSSSLISVGNYRYNTSDQIGLGYVSNVYKGHHAHTSKIAVIKIKLLQLKSSIWPTSIR